MMAALMNRWLTALLLLALMPTPVSEAQAEEAGRRSPIFFWGVQQGAARDTAIEAAVRQRLQEMGETVLPAPQGTNPAPCGGPACGLSLRGSLEAPVGRVIGSHIDVTPTGERRVRLWWVELATSKVVSRGWTCRSCDLVQMLPREAARLLSAAPSLPADPADGCDPPRAVEAPAPPSPSRSDLVRTAIEQGVVLSLRALEGARVPTAKLTKNVQETLLAMGIRATVRPSVAPGAGGQPDDSAQAVLDIKLAGQPRSHGAVESIAISLQAQGRERRLRFYCPQNGCQDQLERSLRINLGVVLDSGELPLVASVEVDPSSRCAAPLPPGPAVASLPQSLLPAASTSTASSADGSGAPSASDSAKPQQTACPKLGSGRGLKIVGGLLLGAGLLGFIPSGYFFGVHGHYTGDNSCGYDNADPQLRWPCEWNSRGAAIGGIVASGAAVLVGGGLLIHSYRRSSQVEGNGSCATTAK
jgi:hypothetical protein